MSSSKKIPPLLVLPANTAAWTFQCWTAFVLSILVITRGLYLLEIDPWVRGFLLIATLFSVMASFTLSKTLRDNRDGSVDTPAWVFMTWASFIIAMITTFTGIYWLPVNGWIKGFFFASYLFVVNATFTLSKTVRDNYEVSSANKPDDGT